MDSQRKFSRLFSSGKIGTLELKNRIVMSPMGTHLPQNETVTEQLVTYIAERARGGAGLITVESARLQSRMADRLGIYDDRFIPGLKRLSDVIHAAGAKAAIEILVHRGRTDEAEPVGPSDLKLAPSISAKFAGIPDKLIGVSPRVLTISEIEHLVDDLGKAANRARVAGFDAITIHGAHGTLVTDFLSPSANQRTDRYGGSIEGRAQFAVELIASAKEKAGKDFPVMFRLSADEHVEGGFSLKDAIPVCQILEKAGVDAIDVSAGVDLYSLEHMIPPMSVPRGCNAHLAQAIKKTLHIPVMVVGRINNPYLAEEILEKGKADFIDLGRALIADPEFPRKAMEGKPEDIRQCIACLRCIDRIPPHKISIAATGCTVNPVVGKEAELRLKPAEKKKKVMVVGGGPGGMEAARVAALRGHDVTLYEREPELGASLLLQAIIRGPGAEELLALARYYRVQMRKLGVKLRLGTEVNQALVEQVRPDVVILATGGTAAVPEISGADRPIVLSQSRMYRMVKTSLIIFGPKLLAWLTNLYLPIGKRVVIIGGGIQGIELAEFLVRRGRKVTVTETSDELGAELVELIKHITLAWLAEEGCTLLSGVKYEEITDKGLTLVTKGGERRTIGADAILPALRLRPNTDLFESLKGKVPEIYVIGDAREPHLILEAVSEGFRTALTI